MNTRTPAFLHLPGALLKLGLAIFLGLGASLPVFAQTSTPSVTASPQANSLLKDWVTADSASIKERLLSTAQVPDEIPPAVTLTDLLREENRRLKQRVENLEKENADLKAKLGGK
jgi:hypothetical protein